MRLRIALLALTAVALGATASPSFAQTPPDTGRPIVSPRPISYDALLRQIERVRKAISRIQLKDRAPTPELVASVPDYAAAQAKLIDESTRTLAQYLAGMESLLQEAERISQNNSVAAGIQQAKIDALSRAAEQTTGEERASLREAAKKQARDAETEIENNTTQSLIQLGERYEQLVASAFSFKNLGATPRHTVGAAKTRLALISSTYLTLNFVPNLAFGYYVNWVGLVFIYTLMEVGVPLIVEEGSDTAVTSAGKFFAYGAFTFLQQKAADKWNAAQEEARDFIEAQQESLFRDCQTSTCVYRLVYDYQRIFKALSGLDQDLEINDNVLESPVHVRYREIKKFLKTSAKAAAEKRPTAVFTPVQEPATP